MSSDRQIRRLENQIKFWSEKIDKIRAKAKEAHALHMERCRTDSQRDHWNDFLEGEMKRADRLYAEHVVPKNKELQEAMFGLDE